MPAYDFHCDCGHSEISVVRKIADRDKHLECPKCHYGMIRQQIYCPMVQVDYAGYESPITGQWIEGKRAHQEDLARHGCRVYEAGETEAFIKNKAKREADFDRRIEAIVEKTATEIGMGA